MSELVLYDIPGKSPESKAWSPNTWRTRYALNYKGLRYRTEWIEYPDIADLCKKIGARPTDVRADGSNHYTLPVLYDPLTETVISESTDIADYLDKTYPDTPPLFPAGTRGFHASFQAAYGAVHARTNALLKLVVLSVCLNLNERSSEYFRRTREKSLASRLEDVAPEGEVRDKWFEGLQDDMAKMAGWYRVGGGPFIMGETLCYADMMIAGRLVWAKVLLWKDSKDWKRICAFDDGFWGKFMERFERYEQVVQGST
ncbi:hypothetical protein BXZ70DRAFT_899021 [Cristinia sonorae]|uniref:GST N-terminal domain-containing protein n=1 Tax=Cristinia sonorae TaxID=1940300 RepID=A0A8K0UI21_9AGAR|nr:hypothetical protein BXZ70DRAFT_899021 [Cristinia sonorae]